MDLSVRDAGGVTVVRINGRADGLTSEQLLQMMTDQIEAGRAQLVADCADLDFASSAGLGALVGGVKRARQHGGDLRLAAVRKAVLNVLEASGLTGILRLYPDVERAVASYAEPIDEE